MVNRNRGEIEAILDGKSYRLCAASRQFGAGLSLRPEQHTSCDLDSRGTHLHHRRGLADALAQWAVGDLSIVSLIRLSQNWALIAGGFGVATLAAKIDRTGSAAKKTGETVSDIAGRALRR